MFKVTLIIKFICQFFVKSKVKCFLKLIVCTFPPFVLQSIILSPGGIRELMCQENGLPFVLLHNNVTIVNSTVS